MKLLVALLACALCSCATATKRENMEELKEAVEAYNHAYRWKNYERAASFRPSDLRAAFIAAYEDDEKSLHIEDFRVLSVDVDGDEAAKVAVRITYTLLPDITVQKRTLTQHWHKVAGSWLLETEDNQLRELDSGATPKNPRALGHDDGEPDPGTEVEVTAPDGTTIRQDGEPIAVPKGESAPDDGE